MQSDGSSNSADNGTQRKGRWVCIAALFYLFALLAGWALVASDGGNHWLVTLYLFSPRWAIALPLLILIPLTAWRAPRWLPSYLLHAIVIWFPLLDFQLPAMNTTETLQPSLRILTCNLGGGKVQSETVAAFVRSSDVDIVLLQECRNGLADEIFSSLDWDFQSSDRLAIGSRFATGPLSELTWHPHTHFNATAAAACPILVPTEQLKLATEGSEEDYVTVTAVTIHFPTFRPAFERARALDPDTSRAIASMAQIYQGIAGQLSQAVESHSKPIVLAGDFNAPSDSVHFQKYWGDYENAFETAGLGFGHTKFTRLHGVRIDHVLVGSQWQVVGATVGPGLGGDHRPVLAEIVLALTN